MRGSCVGAPVVVLAFQSSGPKESTVASPSPVEQAQELQKMLVTYAKQEITDPLQTLKGYLVFGVGGAMFMFLSVFFVAMGALRWLQGFDKFAGGGGWSLIPYTGCLLALFLMMGMVVASMLRAKKRITS